MDGAGLSFRHFLKFARSVGTVRLYMKFFQEATPINIRQIHFINTSGVIHKIFMLMWPFLKREIIEMIHFHTQGLQSLLEFVAKDVLPQEYGGEFSNMNDIFQNFMEFSESKRYVMRCFLDSSTRNLLLTFRTYLMKSSNWEILD